MESEFEKVLLELLEEQMRYDWLLLDASGLEYIRRESSRGEQEREQEYQRLTDIFERLRKAAKAL